MDSFLDTNVPLAYVFAIEPRNTIAKKIFGQYDKFFWSDNVRSEFDHRFNQKQTTLSSFFNDLQYYVEKSNSSYFTKGQMISFAHNWYCTNEKQKRDIIQAANNFWNKYLPYNSRSEKMELENKLVEFIMDLNGRTCKKADNVPNLFTQEIVRTKKYPKIFAEFTKLKMDECDKEIVLDAHDFGLTHPIDFITFDDLCKTGASLDELSFKKVLGRFDF